MDQDNDTLICAICGTTGFTSSQILKDPIPPTALREILRSNVPPPAKWEARLRDVIQKAPAELDKYDAEIGQLQILVSRLTSERAAISSHLDACRSVFAPIRRLPAELLTEIVEVCASSKNGIIPASCTTPAQEMERLAKRPLLELSQVCSLWHEVAIGTPHLWSTIVINTSNWRQPSLPRSLSLLASCLSRGGDNPLKIRISGASDDPGAPSILELLCQHARRWKDCHFGVHHGLQYLLGAKGNLPILKTLFYSPHFEEFDIFEVAPALTDVIFMGRPQDVGKLPWPQIRNFTYSGGNIMSPAFSSFAQSIATGTTFTFTPIVARVDPGLQPHPIVSNMEILAIVLGIWPSRSNENGRLEQILDSLTVPYLRRFRLMPSMPDCAVLPLWSSEHFLAFSQRSSLHTHLVSLEIGAQITDEELLRCLSGLPLLEELRIQSEVQSGDIFVTDALLNGLTRKPDVAPLIPQLRFFGLTSVFGFTDDALCDFLTSRTGPDRLFEIALHSLRHPRHVSHVGLVKRLTELESKGSLKLKVG
ncbi:hypothetical protein DFH06DRAFT_1486330 [Mycena polygramma]|nr:hypothetical protein DFH06DRAFT_1486330 [Mycena polygramma]